jgi:hypothetical protein
MLPESVMLEKVPYRVDAATSSACRCGHDKHHVMVSASPEYTFSGWCLILIGITATPKALSYTCRQCEQVIERTTDPKVIAETRLWG